MSIRELFRHGLALDAEPPDPDLDSFCDALATEIVRRRLAPLVVLLLASGMPLSVLVSQLMIFAEPVVQTFLPTRAYRRIGTILEDRARAERFLEILEAKQREKRKDAGAG